MYASQVSMSIKLVLSEFECNKLEQLEAQKMMLNKQPSFIFPEKSEKKDGDRPFSIYEKSSENTEWMKPCQKL